MTYKLINLSDVVKLRNENIKDNSDSTLVYVSTANMNPEKGGVNTEDNDSIGKNGKKFYSGDVLVSNIRPYFKKIWKADRDGISSADVLNFVPIDGNLLDKNYLYYLLSADRFFEYMTTTAKGTKMPRGDKKAIKKYKVPSFTLSEQKEIANILSPFDDKIENNNAVISNLEEQAQAIFKFWFIDFRPLQDEEYEITKLGELFNFVKGKKPKNISEVKKEGYVPYLVKKYIDNNEVTFASNKEGILIDDLDVFMLMDGANSGNIYYGYSGILGSTFSWLKNDNKMLNEYLYWYLLVNQESIRKQNTGSAIPHANKDYINNLEVNLPKDINNSNVLNTLRQIRLYSINLRRENNKLTEIRDTLLPKLMSGEIQVEERIEVE